MMGIPPVEPHKLAVRGIPISDLPEAAGKGLKTPESQSADCRGCWALQGGSKAGAGPATLRGV